MRKIYNQTTMRIIIEHITNRFSNCCFKILGKNYHYPPSLQLIPGFDKFTTFEDHNKAIGAYFDHHRIMSKHD